MLKRSLSRCSGIALAGAIWCLSALSLGYAGEPGQPDQVLRVPRTDDFEVTGRGDAPNWEKAQWEPLRLRTAKGNAYATRVKMLYSATGLYVLTDAADGAVTATMNEDFLDLWNEDVGERPAEARHTLAGEFLSHGLRWWPVDCLGLGAGRAEFS